MDIFVKSNCISKQTLNHCLTQYFEKQQNIDPAMLPVILNDFELVYDCEWIIQDYLQMAEIDGTSYEVSVCQTDFSLFDSLDKDNVFRFYMLFEVGDNEEIINPYDEDTILYIVNPLEPEDFEDL